MRGTVLTAASFVLLMGFSACERSESNVDSGMRTGSLTEDDIADPGEEQRASRDEQQEARRSKARAQRERPRSRSKNQIPAPEDVAEPPPDAEKTESGLASKVLKAGTGTKRPGPRDKVTIHFTGWTPDGDMIDSTTKRGEPITVPLDRVIKGWSEGLQLMVKGEKRRLWIPAKLTARGPRGRPQGPMVFDMELVDIEPAPEPIPAPPDVARPPANAKKTESGLASRVLKKGTGKVHPTAESIVRVHYTGWTTDGEMFDSSVQNGEPATFPLNRVIKGWTEGLQLMVEGEKRRLWIPEELAYKGRPGAPQGMLVFDVELLKILR